MKKQLLFLTAVLTFITLSTAQSKACEKTCVIDKVVHEGAFLGVQFGSPCDKEHKTDKGVIVLKVVENTAAADNDFKVFDVVLSVDDVAINGRGKAMKIIGDHNPFDVVKLTINRDGRTITKNVTLGARTTKMVQEEVCCEASLSTLNKDNISVFPSPASENLNITFKAVVQDDYKFEIYMANGVLVKEYKKRFDSGNLSEIIPVSKMDDGVYVLKISNNQKTFSKLFVVNRK